MICSAFLEAGFGYAVLDVVRHGFGGDVENGRLVHVVPEARNAVVEDVIVECTPPLAGDLTGEVGEDRWTGPHDARVDVAVRIFDEVIAGDPRFIKCGAGTSESAERQ